MAGSWYVASTQHLEDSLPGRSDARRDRRARPIAVPTRQGYDRWATVYDQDDNPLVILEERELGRHLGKMRGLSVADIGCGTGRHSLKLAKAGAHVIGVDFSDGMLAKARLKAGSLPVCFVKHDLARPLPLESGSFDGVLCCLVLDHISDSGALLRELARICRPRGFVLISVMHPAMELCGVQARFTDPLSGEVVCPESVSNQISDYVTAATQAGLRFDHMSEHTVDHALVARSPRAAKYLGWPLLLLMKLSSPDKVDGIMNYEL